jgi:hypothetical protein
MRPTPTTPMPRKQSFRPRERKTITKPGLYIVKADLTFAPAAGDAITIAAPNVILDLGGRSLTKHRAFQKCEHGSRHRFLVRWKPHHLQRLDPGLQLWHLFQ